MNTYLVRYFDFDGNMVTDYVSADSEDEVYTYYMLLDEVLEVDSIELADWLLPESKQTVS